MKDPKPPPAGPKVGDRIRTEGAAMKPKRMTVARIQSVPDGWKASTARTLLDVLLRRSAELEVTVPSGDNPDFDDAGEGFYVAEIWEGDEERSTLFNVLTRQPVSRGLRW